MNKRGFHSDEWMHRNVRAIQEFVQPRTVPLLLFDDTIIRPDRLIERVSGVLVKLGDHHFILTAGHCAKSCAKAKGVVIPIVAGWSVEDAIRLSPALAREIMVSNAVTTSEGTVDFGYIELDVETAGTMAAKFYVFTGRLTVGTPESSPEDEWVIVGGYPGDEAQKTERSDEARFMITLTLVARRDELPEELPTVPGAPDGFETLDLLLPRDSFVSPEKDVYEQSQPSSYQGVSGGGCWTLDVSRDAVEWSPDDKPSLRAIHTGTMSGDKFLREVPVGYHLRLIADDYPDLADDLNTRWPRLKDFYFG